RLRAGTFVTRDTDRGVNAERGVVVESVILCGTVVNHLVTLIAEMVLQLLAELETSVIRGDVYTHGTDSSEFAAPVRSCSLELRTVGATTLQLVESRYTRRC